MRLVLPALAAACLPLLVGCPPTTVDDDDATGDDDDSGDDDDDATGGERFGPDNGWWSADAADVPPEPARTGITVGDSIPYVSLWDQHDDEVHLYQFYGQLVVIDIIAEWCEPCRDLAPRGQAFWAAQDPDRLTYLAMGSQDAASSTPGQHDALASRWASDFDLTHPVLNDYLDVFDVSAFPTYLVLDHELRVVHLGETYAEVPWRTLPMALDGRPGEAEVCGDGIDNDVDLKPDCLDDDCAGDPACEETSSEPGDVQPCDWAAEGTVDTWRISVPAGSSTLVTVDTVDAEHTFESLASLLDSPGDYETRTTMLGDDEVPCTFAPARFRCAQGLLPAGEWEVAVLPGSGGPEIRDGACADPLRGSYTLRLTGSATATQVLDDASFADLPGLAWLDGG